MSHPRSWEIEAWLEEGAPRSSAAAELFRHVESCPRCAREAAWLRAERRLFAARATSEPIDLPPFDRIEQRLRAVEAGPAARSEPEPTPVRPETKRWGYARIAGPLAAAAAALALFGRQPSGAGSAEREDHPEEPQASALAEQAMRSADVSEPSAPAPPRDDALSSPSELICANPIAEAHELASCEDVALCSMSCEAP